MTQTPDNGGPTAYIMGRGEVLTAFGIYQGMPCICFGIPDAPGKVGEPVLGQEANITDHGTVIAFSTVEAMEDIVELLIKSGKNYADAMIAARKGGAE